MADEKVTGAVEAIEAEAEKVLEEARAKAKAIILKSREEAAQILTSTGDMDDVKAECESIKQKAIVEAESKAEEYKELASKIKANATTKMDGIIKNIVSIVAGEKS